MEIQYLGDKSVKVKTKNTSIAINPDKKIDGDFVMLTEKPVDYTQFEGKLVIDGPGEYEVSGVLIKGEKVEGGYAYDMTDENQTVLVVPTDEALKTRETEGYVATVVLSNSSEELPPINSEIAIVVSGNASGESVKAVEKINLKKLDEYKGFLVHLTK